MAEADYSLRARLVKNEYGIALSTRTGAESIYLSGLKFIPLSEPVDTRVQTLFWRKDRKLSPQAEELLFCLLPPCSPRYGSGCFPCNPEVLC